MNKFVEIYKDARERGKNDLEAYGIAASHIVIKQGTIDDLYAVDLCNFQDVMKELEEANKSLDAWKEEKHAHVI